MSDEPEKVNLETPDLAGDMRAALEELFPGTTEDGVLDAAKIGELIDLKVAAQPEGRERFGLQWAGKREAVRSLLTQSRAALVPDVENSIDFDNAKNVFIEGDNLEALKLLQKAYNDKVKLIYIDPPYNTGGDFVYNDDFQDGLRGYLEYTGQLDQEGKRTSTDADTSGRRHSKWLSMMYPRLMLARNLLAQDGIILVHIDENEMARLSLMLDEIFGPENNLGEIIWDKRNPKGDATKVSNQHEFILAYARSSETFVTSGGFTRPKAAGEEILRMASLIWGAIGTKQIPADLEDVLKRHGVDAGTLDHLSAEITPPIARKQFADWLRTQPFSGGELAYKLIDDNGDVYRPVSMAWPNKKRAPDEYFIPLVHPTTGQKCPVPERGWRNPPQTMQRLLDADQILFGDDETTQPQRKYLLRENMTIGLSSVIPFGGSDDQLLSDLGVPFENPKPVGLVRQLVAACTSDGDLVLDFFAGSGSTAHAVALQNEADGGKRRTISVNIPEPTDERSDAFNAGFATVADITLARLKKVAETVPAAAEMGLRTLRLAPSNFREGPSEGTIFDLGATTLKSDKPNWEAIATQVLLSDGVPLDAPFTRRDELVEVDGVAVGLTNELDEALIDRALDLVPRVLILMEDGFSGKDALKANAVTNARNRGITLKTV
ncbi:MAG: site-specific DNA-methyltransferase [Solirubrobacterales bacterium]